MPGCRRPHRIILACPGCSLDIIPLLGRRTQAMHAFLGEKAVQGKQPWSRLWQEGHGDAWQADTPATSPSDETNGTRRSSDGLLLRLPRSLLSCRK